MTELCDSAPRCFGFASAYGADDDICRACVAVNECAVKAGENLAELAKIIDVGNVKSMHSVSPPKRVIPEPVEEPPSEIQLALLRGENPFSVSHKPAFLRPITMFILNGGGNKSDIVKLLKVKFDIPTKSAEKKCNIIVSELLKTGAFALADERVTIKGV